MQRMELSAGTSSQGREGTNAKTHRSSGISPKQPSTIEIRMPMRVSKVRLPATRWLCDVVGLITTAYPRLGRKLHVSAPLVAGSLQRATPTPSSFPPGPQALQHSVDPHPRASPSVALRSTARAVPATSKCHIRRPPPRLLLEGTRGVEVWSFRTDKWIDNRTTMSSFGRQRAVRDLSSS